MDRKTLEDNFQLWSFINPLTDLRCVIVKNPSGDQEMQAGNTEQLLVLPKYVLGTPFLYPFSGNRIQRVT